ETARYSVPIMRQDGPDNVITPNHGRVEAGRQAPMMAHHGLHLAAVEGIDGVLALHPHLLVPGPDYEGIEGADIEAGTLNGKPAVMAGFWGSHMGLVDLLLEIDEQGAWSILSHTVEARPIYERIDGTVTPTVESDETVLEAVETEHEETLADD